MDLEKLLNQQLYTLPASNNTGKPFITFYETIINNYISDIKTSSDLLKSYNQKILDYSDYYQSVEILAKKIPEILKLSLKGDISKAYLEFDSMMKKTPILTNHFPSSIYSLKRTDVLYRAKFLKTSNLASQDYFFHTPFEHNNKVKSTRFSLN